MLAHTTAVQTAPVGSIEETIHRLGKPYAFIDLRSLKAQPVAAQMRLPKYDSNTFRDLTRVADGSLLHRPYGAGIGDQHRPALNRRIHRTNPRAASARANSAPRPELAPVIKATGRDVLIYEQRVAARCVLSGSERWQCGWRVPAA